MKALILPCLVMLLAGCQRAAITAYEIPKEQSAPTQAAAAAENEPAQKSIHWQKPKNWEEKAPGAMRQAFFTVAGPQSQTAQVTIIMLAGMAGGELDNVNRWRNQVGQGPVSAEDLKQLTETVPMSGSQAHLFDAQGTPPGSDKPLRILAAVLVREGQSWFFKMTGDPSLVGEQKNTFIDFLKTVHFAAQSPNE